METHVDKLNETKKKLDNISDAFCLAKYEQPSLYLHLGTTNSCCFANIEKYDDGKLDQELYLFNQDDIKQSRKLQKDGLQTEDCKSCWDVENRGQISERIFESTIYSDRFEEISNMNPADDFTPSYIVVIFSNICDFKCSYCISRLSSRWADDIKRNGIFKTKTQQKVNVEHLIVDRNNNKYIETFFRDFNKTYNSLKQLRVTGGEPTLHKELYSIIDYVKEHPRKDFTLAINTNLSNVDRLIKELKQVDSKISINTSCDTYGKQAEYLRLGLNYKQWLTNCYRVLEELPLSFFGIMCTFTNLSVTNDFMKFIDDMIELRRTFYLENKKHIILFNLSSLIYPDYQSIVNLPDYFDDKFLEIKNHIEQYKKTDILPYGFSKQEILKFNRTYDRFKNKDNIFFKSGVQQKKDFYIFFNEYDRRNELDFLTIFPEYEKFWDECKDLSRDITI